MIYLFKVYILVIVLVLGPVLTLFLLIRAAAALLGALRMAAVSAVLLWLNSSGESFSVSQHLKSKKALHEGAT